MQDDWALFLFGQKKIREKKVSNNFLLNISIVGANFFCWKTLAKEPNHVSTSQLLLKIYSQKCQNIASPQKIVNKLYNFVPSTRMMVRYRNLPKPSREITPKITSYGRGYLIYGKNGIVFAEKSNMQEGNLIDVSESGRTVRRYVRIWSLLFFLKVEPYIALKFKKVQFGALTHTALPFIKYSHQITIFH